MKKHRKSIFFLSLFATVFTIPTAKAMEKKDVENKGNIIQKELDHELSKAMMLEEWNKIKPLLEQGADPNIKRNGAIFDFPLRFVALHHPPYILATLLTHKANPNQMNNTGKNALHNAIRPEDMECLLRHGTDPDHQDMRGNTPLHYTETVEQAQILFKYNAHTKKNKNGKTPVEYAAEHKRTNVATASLYFAETTKQVRNLLKYGADPTFVDKDGNTPLEYLMKKGKLDVATALLHFARTAEQIQILLKCGAKPAITNRNRGTPLEHAMKNGNLDVAAALLKHSESLPGEQMQTLLKDTDPTIVNKDKKTSPDKYNRTNVITALLCLAKTTKQTQALLELGANPTIIDKNGDPALEHAMKNGNLDVASALLHFARTPEQVQILLKCGADPTIIDKDGNTPLEYAMKEGNLDITAVLQDWTKKQNKHIAEAILTIKELCPHFPKDMLNLIIDMLRKNKMGSDFNGSRPDTKKRNGIMNFVITAIKNI